MDACELWWLQKQANNSGADFGFLKYPHIVDRKLEWFQAQVRSGTLHTEEVVHYLYNTNGRPKKCVWCQIENESVLHCLVRCPRAVKCRRLLAMTVGDELMELEVARQSFIDIWFDNLRLMEGKLSRRPAKNTFKE